MSAEVPSDLQAQHIVAQLRTRRYGRSLDVRARTASTNDDARDALRQGAPEGHVVIADAQEAGRGSKGRSWSSPAGSDLYLSIVDRPAVEAHMLPQLTLAVGLGVADAVDELIGHRDCARLKWPNDVRLFERKCGGILIEAYSGEQPTPVIIGIGLNVNRRSWPPDIDALATSLARASGRSFARDRALVAVLEHTERWVQRYTAGGSSAVVGALGARLAWVGREVVCEGVRGTLLGVSDNGGIRIATGRGERELIAGTLELVQ